MPTRRFSIPQRFISYIFCPVFLFLYCFLVIPNISSSRTTLPATVQTIDSGNFSIEYPAGMEKYAGVVAGASQLALRNLNSSTQDPLAIRITIKIAATETEFHSLVSANAENSVAVSVSKRQLLIINLQRLMVIGDGNLPTVLTHELMHVYLDVRCLDTVPIWLHEGLAQIVAPASDQKANALLIWYALNKKHLPLNDLRDKFPAAPAERELAYMQSLSFVSFIATKYYGGNLPELLRAITGEAGKYTLQQFSSPSYVSVLENEWVQSLTRPGNWFEIMLGDGIFWFVAILLLVAAWWKLRKRKKSLHEQWDREDSGEAVWSRENEDEFAPTFDPYEIGMDDSIKCETSDWEPENKGDSDGDRDENRERRY